LLRTLIFSALLTIAGTAFAEQHYVEVCEPSEARSSAPSNGGSHHKLTKKRAAPTRRTAVRSKQHEVLKSVAAPLPTRPATERRVPTFDDIPRKRTPHGDVLRVHVGTMQARVQR